MSTRPSTTIVPLLFFLIGIAGTLFLYQLIETNERQRLRLETEITAEQVRMRLEAWIDSRTSLAEHLSAGQFVDRADIDENFKTTASAFVALYPGIQALNFIDRQWVIRLVVPQATNAPALNKDLHQHPSPGVVASLQKAEDQHHATRTPIIDLLQGGKGFATYHPLTDTAGNWLGFVNGVFRIQELVDACLYEDVLRERFTFSLTDGDGTEAYNHRWQLTPHTEKHGTTTPLRVVDRDWIVHLAPDEEYLAQSSTPADEVMALVAIILITGLALLLRFSLIRQETLSQSQAKYRLLVENQIDLVVQLDPQGNFLYVSPSYCEAFGREESELLGENFLPVVHPDDREQTLAALTELEHPPHRSYVEQRSVTAQGTVWQAWTNAAVLGPDGKLKAINAVGRDVTRRRELEDKLAFSSKMQAVDQLAGGIAHDFNNLLQSMLGNLQFVVQDTTPTGQTATDLQEIEKGIDKAMVLTRQLLTFSRRQGLVPKREDLNTVVGHTIEQFRSTLRSSINLVFSPAEQEVPVQVDRGQIEQMVQNLCNNARDAIATQGKINVSTSIRKIDKTFCEKHTELQPGDYATLVVADDGHGMTPDVLTRVFEPFYTTREVGAGTGLGLATIYGIAQQHHGTILAASTDGLGSDFTILLPLVISEDEKPLPPKMQQPQTGNRETILLAEDDHSVRDLAVRVLERANYTTLTAEDGLQAIEVFTANQEKIDLVMLDMVMPKMNGREAREAIMALRPDMPILFASGFDPATLAADGPPIDEQDILMKPYGIPDLLHKVREVLDRE